MTRGIRNWREWFVPPEETSDPEDTARSRLEMAAAASGSRHSFEDHKTYLKGKTQPRCVSCNKFMGYSSGMYILINDPWRLHIACFNKVVEERFEDGEVIDLTTGQVYQIEDEETEE